MAQYTPIGQPSPAFSVSRKPLGSSRSNNKAQFSLRDQEVYSGLGAIDETSNDFSSSQSVPDSRPSYGFRNEIPEKRSFNRRSTRNSIFSSASTLWDYGVSHFKIPKLASPWEHAMLEKNSELPEDTSGSIRVFNHRRQRRRLFINSTFQWIITAILCGGLAALLAGFSTYNYLTQTQRHTFNALVTMLSLLIGLNLAASLRGFAQLLRWRFLAAQYRSLQQFQMIFNCESQMDCVRLLWAGRTQGRLLPNMTQLLAFTSLLVNVGLQVATALVGLTYSMDVSTTWVLEQYGQVSVVDLSIIRDVEGFADPDLREQALVANQYGIAGTDFSIYTQSLDDDSDAGQGWIYTNELETQYWYRFIDQNPNSTSTQVSDRIVTSTATCTNLTVLQGGFSGYSPVDPLVQYMDASGKKHWLDFISISNEATGSTSYMVNNTQCGPRCADIFALIGANNASDVPDPDIPWPLLYHCQNNISQVTNTNEYINSSAYLMPAEVAGLFAGAIGWSGVVQDDSGDQVHLYADGSLWSPMGTFYDGTPVANSQAAANEMAKVIMQFSAAAIASMDNLGPRQDITGWAPVQAQVVTVDWRYAISTLAAITAIHFILLLCVIAWANKAIIKDNSALSTARLFRPIVDKLGDHGCLLTGDEIAEELKNVNVIYGVRTPHDFTEQRGVRHVDILEEDEGLGRQGLMPAGRYDGHGRGDDWRRKERRMSI